MLKTNLSELEKKLGFTFPNHQLLTTALTHRSFLNENRPQTLVSNERLEFLGDAVLQLWATQQVYQRFPDLPEGQLTFIRTFLVRTESLAQLAQKVGLGEFLLLSHGEELDNGRQNPVLLANAFEAVVGAAFLDRGLEALDPWLAKIYRSKMHEINDLEKLKDRKSLLQEKVQTTGQPPPLYRTLQESGPDHYRLFTVGVYCQGELVGQGQGRSKQEAEEAAATQALEKLKQKG